MISALEYIEMGLRASWLWISDTRKKAFHLAVNMYILMFPYKFWRRSNKFRSNNNNNNNKNGINRKSPILPHCQDSIEHFMSMDSVFCVRLNSYLALNSDDFNFFIRDLRLTAWKLPWHFRFHKIRSIRVRMSFVWVAGCTIARLL